MRIAITSDIHYFPQWEHSTKHLASILEAHRPDVLVLAGDIGEPLDMFIKGLEVMKDVCSQRAALAGNHDVWHRALPYSSERLWTSLLQEAAQAHDYTWLDQENMVVGELGICGSLAWYDYGGRHPHLNFNDEFYAEMKPKISNDGNYIDWPWTDREFAQRIGGEFEERLSVLETRDVVHDILVITHVPLFKECLKPIESMEQGLLNAYYANLSLGERVLARRKVRAVVSGHVHQACHLAIPRLYPASGNGHGPLSVYTIPSDYGRPAAVLLDTNTWQAEFIRLPGA
jgi:3',5'-cyclic AMP phosphodiesterase CpdA